MHVEAPAGSTVYVDAPNRRARIIYPDQRIKAWDGFKVLDARPDRQTWMITWNIPGDDRSPRISFSPAGDYIDDEIVDIVMQTGFEFYAEDIQGDENTRWPEFVRMVKDPLLNPAGFPLRSGVYVHAFVSFKLNFGEDGSVPTMEPVYETLPPTLDFPYQAEINIVRPFTHDGQQVPAGWFRTKVTGYRTDTGEVTDIECRSSDFQVKFNMGGAQLVRLIHEGRVELLNVVEDRMPNF